MLEQRMRPFDEWRLFVSDKHRYVIALKGAKEGGLVGEVSQNRDLFLRRETYAVLISAAKVLDHSVKNVRYGCFGVAREAA